jgi:hypothetical protein
VFIAPLSAASKRALASFSENSLSPFGIFDMALPTEPSSDTKAEIGSLCGAWAYLEIVTEQAIWGILKLDMKIGPLVTWRLDMKMRWDLILKVADDHIPAESAFLRKLNKGVVACTRDRNIVVHGVVHALIKDGDPNQPKAFWTVFRGAEAGKKFPISTAAVRIVRENVQYIGHQLAAFNERHKFSPANHPGGGVEQTDWPKPLEQ